MEHYEFTSARLGFRRLRADDFRLVAPILQNEKTMYAWEHGFSYDEICDWIAGQVARYQTDGYGYLAGIDRKTGKLIALAGPLSERVGEKSYIGIGYIVARTHWGERYGVECAQAALYHAFTRLEADRVVALIRPENHASRRVAEACCMRLAGECVKYYRGKDMPHLIYELRRPAPKM
ncbi:GNAT family N-acetyltransferase [Agathobaculum sp.]|uniref:GNAT family N-acetyltransferase n=1 Tax=Agathobaculum sp. TaxID=2048138 RepID=UPI002A7EE1CC|nr:GNAT family N-acetyltransferase [Agathobaculum sp.]MDY3617513.1 GNAT family N-acetyltransferase [Agathobaculum sp.]